MTTLKPNAMQVVTRPGALANSRLVLNLDDRLYHSDLHIQSCSMLKNMLDSPALYLNGIVNRPEPTKDMEFGTLVHILTLEPHTFFSKVAVFPGIAPGRTEKKEFVEQHPGMMVIDEAVLHLAECARDRLLEQTIRGRKFGDYLSEGEPEATIYYTDPDTGVECRTRLDLRHPEINIDLKTTGVVDNGRWVNHALRLRYDVQAYMYSLADCLFTGRSSALPFCFLSVESDYPLSTMARTAGESFMAEGAKKYRHAIASYAACAKADYWPSPSGEEVIEITPWQVEDLTRSWAHP